MSSKRLLIVFCLVLAFMAIAPLKTTEAAIYWDKWFSGGQLATVEAIAFTPYSATLKGYVDWGNRHGGHDLVLWAKFKYRDITADGNWKTLTVSPVPTYGGSFSEKLNALTPGHTYEFYAVVKMTSSGTHEDQNGIKKFQTPGGDATPWNAYSSVGVVATQDPWGIGQYEATLRGHVEWENQNAMIDLVRSAHFTFIDLTDSSKGWQTVTVSPVPTSGGDYSVTLKGLTPGHTYKYYTYVHMTMSGKHEDSAHAKTFTTKEGNGTPWDEYSSRGVVATLEAQNVTQYGAELRGYVNWDNKNGMIDLVKSTKFYYEDTNNPNAGPREVSGSVPSNGGYFSARLSGLVPGHTYRFYAIVDMTMTGSHHDSKHTLTFTTQPGQAGSWQPPNIGHGTASDGIVATLPVTNVGKYSADLNCHVEWQNKFVLDPDWISELGFVYSDGTITGQTRQASKSLIVFPVATKGGDFTVHLKGLQPGRTYACYPYVEMAGVDPKWMSRAPAVEFTTLPGTGTPWQDEYSIGIISTLPAENVTDTSAVLRAHVEWQDQVYYHNLVLEAGFKYQDITAGDKEWETARVTLIPTYGGDFSVKITGLTKGHAYRFYPWVTMTMQGPGHGHYNDQEHAHVFTAGGQNKINIEANLPMGYVGKSYSGTLTASGGDGNYTWSGSVQGSSYRVAKNNGLVLYPDGIISGAPLEITPENLPLQVWVTVTDTSGNVGTGTFTIPVEEPLRITNQSLPGCVVGTPYKTSDGKTVTLTAAGGKGPYTWTGTINPANGLTFNADGSIAGTPQKAGTSLVQARLTDSKGRIATANLSIRVVDRMSITTTSLPDGIAGLSYQTSDGQPVKLTATGGDGRYTWSGSISPANGMTLKADGSIIGTPQAPAVSTITATLKDGFGQKASATFTIRVVKQMQITTTMLPGGVTGEYYKPFDAEDITLSDIQKWASSMDYSSFGGKLVTLAATGGDGKYTWNGTITPANGTLKVTADGQIIGIPDKPTGATPLTVQVEVKDGSGNKAKASFKLFINDPLPAAFAGKLYSIDLAGSGGDGKYTWSGTVTPANGTLKVTADGKITGTPAAATTPSSSLTVQAVVKDGSGNAGGINLRLSVLDKDAQPLTITTQQLPEAETNQYYLYLLKAAGGKGPYTWAGSITPANGLVVDRSGVISGKPKSSVTSVVDVTVTDSTGTRAKAEFTIKPKGLITLNLAETTIDMDNNSQLKCFFTVNPADAVVSAYSSNSGTVSCSLGGSGGSYWLNLNSGLPTSDSYTTAVITVSASKAGYTGTTRSFSVRVPYKAPYIKVVSNDYASSDDVYIRTAPRLTTLTAAPGTVAGSTKLALGHDGAVSYAVCILGDVYAYPNVGDRIPAWVNPYIPEANIENVTAGMRLGIYALDSNGRVIAFSDHVLSASEIAAAAPPIESFEVLPVNEDRVTAITNLSHPGTSSYVIYVQAGPFATPLVGDSPPAGAVPYDEEAEINEITGVDAGWHLGIFALDLEGKIIAFSDHELVAFVQVSNITGVPTTAFVGIPLTLTGTVQPDNATNQAIVWSVTDAGTTGATIAGNTLSTTAAGTAIVTATIVNGSEPGIDYTQAFEIEVREFELDPAPPLTTVTAEPGTIANSTRLTNLNYDGAVSYAVCILGDFYAHPNVGDSLPAGVPAYNLGDNITDVTAGTRLGIYALDSDGKVIAFSDPELAASEIAAAAPPIESFEVLPVNDGVTKITDLSHTDAVSYAVCVRDSAFDTPLVGDSPPGDAVPYDAAEAQLINDVEEGQHLGIFALDSENKIIAFSDYVLEAWQE